MILHQPVQMRLRRLEVLQGLNFRLGSLKMKNKNKKVQGVELPEEAQGKDNMN